MKHGRLVDYFSGFGYKRLQAVEVDPRVSHGHEFNGTSQLKQLFGNEKCFYEAKVIYLLDDAEDYPAENVTFTWYDARENTPGRTEYRLYYRESSVISMAVPEDLMIVAKNSDSNLKLTVLIAKHGDTVESQLAWVFGISLKNAPERSFQIQKDITNEMNYFSSMILEKAGIQRTVEDKNDDILGKLLEKFHENFPSTMEFSEFSRTLVPDVNVHEQVDSVLMAWIEAEENAFRIFEHYQIQKRIKLGFATVDEFISYSLGVQNRRKSRAGHALENQLKFVFEQLGVKFASQAVTEAHAKPDFLFPGISEYRDPNFPSIKLSMLGAKTTCKDRWPLVLSEAARIERKHLITLEPSISESQTGKMEFNKLQLVVPSPIFPSYTQKQREWLWDVEGFVNFVLKKQQE